MTPIAEASQAIREISVEYQIVTDETSMIVVSDADFAANGVDRNNAERSAQEHAAEQVKMQSDPSTNAVTALAPSMRLRHEGFVSVPGAHVASVVIGLGAALAVALAARVPRALAASYCGWISAR